MRRALLASEPLEKLYASLNGPLDAPFPRIDGFIHGVSYASYDLPYERGKLLSAIAA